MIYTDCTALPMEIKNPFLAAYFVLTVKPTNFTTSFISHQCAAKGGQQTVKIMRK
jgi:hypothetical protein